MAEPVVHAISVVRNEADILRLCLEHASRFCQNIWVLDNDSNDGTWDILLRAADELGPVQAFERRASPYFGRGLHAHVFHSVAAAIEEGEWVMILDADEFQERDPRPGLAEAEAMGCGTIQCLQAQFFVTRADLSAEWFLREEGEVRGLHELPTRYRIDWIETRFFRYRRGLEWPAFEEDGVTPHTQALPTGLAPACGVRLLNRHYQYRSRVQMEMRTRLRSAQFGHLGTFRHWSDPDWRTYVQSAKKLRSVAYGESVVVRPWTVPYIEWRRRSRRLVRRIHRKLGG